MSALPQRKRPAAAPRPRPTRKLRLIYRLYGYHRTRTRADVIKKYQKSTWAARALSLDVARVTANKGEMGWILFVHLHSAGSPDPHERKASAKCGGFTPVVVTPEDFAKEFGLSVQWARTCVEGCIEKGFTPAMGDTGEETSRFRVDLKAMAKAPNAYDFEPRREGGAFCTPRKPAESESEGPEGGEEEANSNGKSTTSPKTHAISTARVVEPGEVAVAAQLGQPARVEVTHALPCAVAILSTVTHSGDLRIHLSSPGSMGEPKPGTPPRLVPSGPAGHAGPPDDLAARLASVDGAPPPDDKMLARLSRESLPDRGFLDTFIEVVQERSTKGKFTAGLYPGLMGDTKERWKNGGKQRWEAQHAGEMRAAALAVEQAARQLAQGRELARKLLAEDGWTEQEREWAREILGGQGQ